MTDKTNFEIPESVRQIAEQSLDQAKDAYGQLMDASRKAQDMVEQSSGAVAESAKDVQKKALNYAESNMKAGFDLAEKLVKAKDFQEALEIQSTFARQQMTTYSQQAQELSQLLSDTAKKAQGK